MSAELVGQLTKCTDFQGFTSWAGIVHVPGQHATRDNFFAAKTRAAVWHWLYQRLGRGGVVTEWDDRTFHSRVRRVR